MDTGQILVLSGLALDAAGIAILSWKPFFVSSAEIEKLSGTYYNGNPFMGPRLFATEGQCWSKPLPCCWGSLLKPSASYSSRSVPLLA